jgi:hypothetical protein
MIVVPFDSFQLHNTYYDLIHSICHGIFIFIQSSILLLFGIEQSMSIRHISDEP